MNKIRKSQNKQNNNNKIYMTIQSGMNEENTTPTSAGLAPSEWAAISQIKTQKKK
jgi:hypothetical protein